MLFFGIKVFYKLYKFQVVDKILCIVVKPTVWATKFHTIQIVIHLVSTWTTKPKPFNVPFTNTTNST